VHELGLTTLEERRNQQEMIQTYKILVQTWNKLPNLLKNAVSVTAFKTGSTPARRLLYTKAKMDRPKARMGVSHVIIDTF